MATGIGLAVRDVGARSTFDGNTLMDIADLQNPPPRKYLCARALARTPAGASTDDGDRGIRGVRAPKAKG
jgi:hypothetical protein